MVENYQYQKSSDSFYHTLIAPLVKLKKKYNFFFFCKLLEKLKKKINHFVEATGPGPREPSLNPALPMIARNKT
jgi:hypothetical protein